ncbi:MAG: T9SS type A sorting domain-containing protein [Bacteroidales bacterium]|nr:T9SS type A sorting domain-containing protein [Bacteroidales bacterium]
MKRTILLLLAVLCSVAMHAQQNAVAASKDNITDSIDVLHYDLQLDMGNHSAKRIEGSAAVTLRVLHPVSAVTLELTPSDVDSVWVDGVPTAFTYSGSRLSVPFQGSVGDTLTITVFYSKGQYVAAEGWGGFYFDNNIYYNLGIALYEYPHNMGKSWFPCRDNFYDKATYRLRITSKPGWRAICSGVQVDEVAYADGSLMTDWVLDHPTPTYLVGVASAPFRVIEREYQSLYGTYPALLGFRTHDSVSVWNAYEHMSRVIPMFEQCFGPYRWDRVGYVATPKGSMEHVGNVAFTTHCMASTLEACLATMSHEFAHSWFGNLLTCASSENMWINEGGASFCEEVAIQAICPEGDSLRYKGYADENLNKVLCSSHVSDGDFIPLYGVTPQQTYGSTVYSKGATVWHSLRGYMGDSLFYASMRRLFDRCAFGNIDSYQLRDSLSQYSGVDLTDFFDFHVFHAGFNDYVIDAMATEGNTTTIHVSQKLYGAPTYMNSNRIGITFFSSELQQAWRPLTFDGEGTTATFQLPFSPAFAVVDYEKALSRAAIGSELTVDQRGTFYLPVSHFSCNVRKAADTNSAFIYVTHHWTRTDTTDSPRFLRFADRYWQVDGLLPSSVKMSGMFHYCRSGSEATLDNDLFNNGDAFQSVRLLYRPEAGSPWTVVSSRYDGNSVEGYFLTNDLKLGQYTLAVVDTNYVGIDGQPSAANSAQWRLFPNPSQGSVTIATGLAGEPLQISVSDLNGKHVLDTIHAVSGEALRLSLPSGVYLLQVKQRETDATRTFKVIF